MGPKRVLVYASFVLLLLGSGVALYRLMFRDGPMVGEYYDLVVDEADQVVGLESQRLCDR